MVNATPVQEGYRNTSAEQEGRLWVPATLKSGAVVTGFVALTLAAYGQISSVAPVLGGALLAGGLLGAMDWFIRRAFTPERAWAVKRKIQQQKRRQPSKTDSVGEFTEKKMRGKAAGAMLLGFALIKYPLVAVLIWALTRALDLRAIMAFTGGFVLIHLVIALRAIGRILFVSEPAAVK
ncbi:MAG: hypothetical protein V4671_24655 [Armatimonadota bacterium]